MLRDLCQAKALAEYIDETVEFLKPPTMSNNVILPWPTRDHHGGGGHCTVHEYLTYAQEWHAGDFEYHWAAEMYAQGVHKLLRPRRSTS